MSAGFPVPQNEVIDLSGNVLVIDDVIIDGESISQPVIDITDLEEAITDINEELVQIQAAATSHTHTIADVTDLQAALNAKAALVTPNLEAPIFTRARGLTTGTDLDSIVSSGFYNVTNPVNGPGAIGSFYLTVIRWNANTDYVLQELTTLSGTEGQNPAENTWRRTRVNGTWYDWQKFSAEGHDHAISDTTGLQSALDSKAPLASPNLDQPIFTRARQLTTSTDLDTLTDAGFYSGSSPVNGPVEGTVNFWYVNVYRHAGNDQYVIQEAFPMNQPAGQFPANNRWLRSRYNGTWTEWLPSATLDSVSVTRSEITSKSFFASIKTIRTVGYSSIGDGGGALYKRVDSAPSHQGKVRSVDRFLSDGTVDNTNGGWWELCESTIKPQMFGADPTGTTDATTAINNAIDYMRTIGLYEPTILGNRYHVDGAGGLFRVAGSINATDIRLGRNWGIQNMLIHAVGPNKVVMDFSGSRFGFLRNIHIWGDQTNTPRTGIQFSRTDTQPCSHFNCDNVSVDGYFLLTAYHMYAGEEHLYNWCRFWNRRVADGSGESWAAILDGAAFKPPTSEYQTIPTGRQSFTVNHYDHCAFQKPFGIAGPTMFIQDIANHKFTSTYITNGSGAVIVWRLTEYVPYAIDMDIQIETTGTDTVINFTADAAAAREIDGLKIRVGNIFTEDQVFLLSTLTGLTINNLDLDIRRWQSGSAPTNGVFNSKAIVSLLNSNVRVPVLGDFGDALTYANYTGTVQDYNNVRRTYGELMLRRGQLTLSDGSIQTQAEANITDDNYITIQYPPGRRPELSFSGRNRVALRPSSCIEPRRLLRFFCRNSGL